MIKLLLLLATTSTFAKTTHQTSLQSLANQKNTLIKTTTSVAASASKSCSKIYFSSTSIQSSDSTPKSLHCSSLGRSAAGNIISISIGTNGVPSAHYLNPTTNQWTSKQTIASVSAEGATIGRATTSGGASDAESGDVFAIFGGQNKDGQYSKQVIKYQSDSGFSVLTNTATGTDASPIGRASGSLTGIQADRNGNIRYLLVGGVDDDSDFADVWILTLQKEANTFTWTKVAAQENGFGFEGRTGHSASRWISSTDGK